MIANSNKIKRWPYFRKPQQEQNILVKMFFLEIKEQKKSHNQLKKNVSDITPPFLFVLLRFKYAKVFS